MKGEVRFVGEVFFIARGEITSTGNTITVVGDNGEIYAFPWPGPFYICWDREGKKT